MLETGLDDGDRVHMMKAGLQGGKQGPDDGGWRQEAGDGGNLWDMI